MSLFEARSVLSEPACAELASALFDASGEALLLLDAAGVCVAANLAAAWLAGTGTAALVGQHAASFLRPRGGDSPEDALAALDTSDGGPVHLVLRSGDAEERDVAVRATRLPGGATLLALADRTEAEAAEQALRYSEERLRSILATTPNIAVQYYDEEGRVLYWNPAAETLYGWRADEVLGRTLGESILAPAEAAEFHETLRRIRETGEPVGPYEIETRRKDGAPRWVLSTTFAVPLAPGCTGFVCMDVDITARREAERDRERLLALLEASLAVTPSGILIADAPDVTIRWANAAALGIRGETDAPLTGIPVEQHSANWQTYRPDGAPYPSEELPLSRAVLRGETTHDELVIIHNAAGEDRWVSVNAAPVRDRAGKITQGIAVFHDVTDRRRAEQERERLQSQLQQAQKMESIGRLAGGVAHDFNNMLGVVLGHADLALAAARPDDAVRSHLEEIRRAAERSTSLASQLLTFARRQTVSPRVLDLNAAVSSALGLLRRLIGEDITLVWTPTDGIPSVRMDPVQVEQVLTNLCTNARDAIAGVGQVTIATSVESVDAGRSAQHAGAAPGRYVVLTVSDNGAGMDEQTLSRVFEPFYTTKAVGHGTGLGLATVYGIVTQNEGFLAVESHPSTGTTFRVFLPAVDERPASGRQPGEREEPRRGSETVLLVEDEPALLDLCQRMLGSLGYRVLSAATPEEAIAIAESGGHGIELLITDVVMPQMNGRELADALRALAPGLRVVYISGYTSDVIARRGVLHEGVHFLQKPFTARDLAAKVREALDA